MVFCEWKSSAHLLQRFYQPRTAWHTSAKTGSIVTATMVGEDPVGDKRAMQTELIEREEMGREEKMKRRGTGPTQVLPAPS